VKRYTVHVTPDAWKEMKELPGNIRQRVRKAVDALADEPRPSRSKALDLPELLAEVRRLRLDRWRIVYIVADDERTIDIVAVRKRPPYDYGDSDALLNDFPHE
jgi:mRNA interferase RelE/StbE